MLLPSRTYSDIESSTVLFPELRKKLTKSLKHTSYFSKLKFKCTLKRTNNHQTEQPKLSFNRYKKSNGNRKNNEDNNSFDAGGSSRSYEKTREFFDNIPDFNEEIFHNFHFKSKRRSDGQSNCCTNDEDDKSETSPPPPPPSLSHDADALRVCEDFLWRYRIRPDFFYKHYHHQDKAIR